jgi:hypothetical protein
MLLLVRKGDHSTQTWFWHVRFAGCTSDNKTLRRVFGPKRGEVTKGWIKLHNDEIHNLYLSLNIIRMIKSRKKRRTGYIILVRQTANTQLWLENLKARNHFEDLGLDTKITLRLFLKTDCELMGWTQLAKNGFHLWVLVSTEVRLLGPERENFLTC